MSDNLKKKRPQDASKVNIHEEWEVRYWCGAFGCSKAELIKAIGKVGVSSAAVRKYLGK